MTQSKNTEHLAQISALSHDGRGIARLAGKTTFIDGALPSETVQFRYTRRHSQYDEGEVTQIIEAASERVPPPCAHFGVCGGCQLQHLSPAQQLAHKQHVFLEQLAHIGGTQPAQVLPPLVGPSTGYRHKARLGVRYVTKKQTTLVGFREKNGRYIAEMHTCAVLPPSVAELIMPLRTLIDGLHSRQHIAQIEVAVDSNAIALIIRHLCALDAHDMDCLREFAQQRELRLYLQPGDLHSIRLFWPEHSTPLLSYTLPAEQLHFSFHPNDFTQVNPGMNQQMVAQALQLLDPKPSDSILDLFCGLGNFTLPLAKYAKEVVGVEGSADMVLRAQDNATRNGINNARFFAADLNCDPQQHTWYQQHYDKILLDPSRTGAQTMMHVIPRLAATHILYVSCNPTTLARDSHILVAQYGYALDSAGIIDMFPHTSHLEAMALFRKN